jgi:AcrR family transcriptional regulator
MLTWTKQREPRRGGAPGLEQVVATAIALADEEGLDAVSMRRVATALHSGTASLYRILDSRDELIDRMVDVVLGRTPPPAMSGEWRDDLAAVARTRRGLLRSHPWLGTELAGRPALGPNALAHHDRAVAAASGLTGNMTLAASAVETLLAFVLGATARELAEAGIQRRSGLTELQWRATVEPYLRQALTSGNYPFLSRFLHEAEDFGADERFERGLTCLLTGIATLT